MHSVDQAGEPVHRSTVDSRAGDGLGLPESLIPPALVDGGQRAMAELRLVAVVNGGAQRG